MERINAVIADDEALLEKLKGFGLSDEQIYSLSISTVGLKVIPGAGGAPWFPVYFHPGAVSVFAKTVLDALQYYEWKEEKELALKAARHLAKVAAVSKDEIVSSAASLFRDVDRRF